MTSAASPSTDEPALARLALRVLALAVAHAATGWLGLRLAAPGDYATALYPPAGIALAAVLLHGWRIAPGIVLASLAMDAVRMLETQGFVTRSGLLAAAAIAVIVAVQALAGAALIRRWVRQPLALDTDRDVFTFLALAGPVSCVIASSAGTGVLVAAGLVEAGGILPTWATWWVGDCLGAMIFAPMTFMALGAPGPIWRRRRRSVGAPLLVVLAAIVLLFMRAAAAEVERDRLVFEEEAGLLAQAVEETVGDYLAAVASIERFVLAAGAVTDDAFGLFVKDVLGRHRGITAAEWVPVVASADRPRYEAETSDPRGGRMTIHELDVRAAAVPAGARDTYYPITHIRPLESNEQMLGFDLGSEPRRRAALQRAARSGSPAITDAIRLLQGSRGEPGVLLIHPVVESGAAPAGPPRVRGFAVAALAMRAIVEDATRGVPAGRLALRLEDLDAPPAARQLHGEAEAPGVMTLTSTFPVAGTTWRLTLSPATSAPHRRPRPSWAILATGLLFATTIQAALLGMTGRTARVERLVLERTEQLAASEERLGAIVESALDSIVTIDERGVVTSFNPTAARTFGFAPDEVLGQNVSILMPEPHRSRHDSYMGSYLETGVRGVIGRVRELVGQRKDGSIFPIELAVSEIRIGGRREFAGIIRDVTERTEMDRMKREFVSTVSHELRTPLTSIKGALRLLRGGIAGELPPKAVDMIVMADDNSDRLAGLIADILDLERIETGRLSMEMAPIPLRGLVAAILDANRGFAEAHATRFVVVGSVPDVDVLGDERRLMQVFGNLMTNAVKFAGRADRIELSVAAQSGRVRVSVRDYGPGIPAAFHPHVFDKFTQADASDTRRRGGSGLGLSIAKAIVERHGGSITFESELGRGTTFHVELPQAAGESGPALGSESGP